MVFVFYLVKTLPILGLMRFFVTVHYLYYIHDVVGLLMHKKMAKVKKVTRPSTPLH